MKLSEELKWRGYLNQTTFDDIKELDSKQFSLYLGTDPSGDSLHIGHLAVYMMVRRFLDHGHKVTLLIGGGTGQVGDPRDSEERELIPLDVINQNAESLAAQVKQLFGGQDFKAVNNLDWLQDVRLLDFLRDTGKHFSMGQLVDREHFKARVGKGKPGMSFAEFAYTLMQGYDFWYLHRNLGVNLQIGGSDQWGNILSGVDLIRKKEDVRVDGMTAPLVIDKTTGRKFGKSEAGEGVWLSPDKTSPYKFYQFWLNVGDEAAVDYLKLYTLLDKPQVDELESVMRADPGARLAQKTLAYEVTKLVHGKDKTDEVVRITGVLFGGEDFTKLDDIEVDLLAGEIPVAQTGGSLVGILLDVGVAKSNGEARRLVASGAISVNGVKVTEDQVFFEKSLVKKGKNTFILVR
ncbi:MAG: tyrosine--tRNA ligase [Candidatus Nomurabacteria bacterium]|jgi:tyrosyl-tRNA synthetase|nr:tyrosine--tRNA ligase [Candidatus Nomurabacteria bacterium]